MEKFKLHRMYPGTNKIIETYTVYDLIPDQSGNSASFIRESGEKGYCFNSVASKWRWERENPNINK